MHGSEPLDSLDFDDHSTFDHKVKAIPAVELDILVHHREWLLLLNFEVAVSEFEDETRLVGRLQQPGANDSVHINGCAEDMFGAPIRRVLLAQYFTLSRKPLSSP